MNDELHTEIVFEMDYDDTFAAHTAIVECPEHRGTYHVVGTITGHGLPIAGSTYTGGESHNTHLPEAEARAQAQDLGQHLMTYIADHKLKLLMALAANTVVLERVIKTIQSELDGKLGEQPADPTLN